MDEKLLKALKEASRKYQEQRKAGLWDRYNRRNARGDVSDDKSTTDQSK